MIVTRLDMALSHAKKLLERGDMSDAMIIRDAYKQFGVSLVPYDLNGLKKPKDISLFESEIERENYIVALVHNDNPQVSRGDIVRFMQSIGAHMDEVTAENAMSKPPKYFIGEPLSKENSKKLDRFNESIAIAFFTFTHGG